MWKKLNQLGFSLGLAGLALVVSTSKVNALVWNFSFTNAWGTALGQITTDGSDYSGGTYQIQQISGTINGNTIVSLNPPNSFGGEGNNRFYYPSVPADGSGWVFTDGVYNYNLYWGGGDGYFDRSPVGVVPYRPGYYYNNFSASPAAEVPFDLDPASGIALGLPLFIGLRYLKKRVASKKLKFNSTGTVS